MKYVRVTACARLHLGFYNFYDKSSGRVYGGIGVGINKPCTTIVIKDTGGNSYKVINYTTVPLDDVIEKIEEVLGSNILSGLQVEILNAIPRHVGLGSTTQTSLAIAYGITRVKKLGYSLDELALLLGRGHVSGIGVNVFKYGGLIIDSGRKIVENVIPKPRSVEDLPKPILRFKLPRNWRFLVLIPRGSHGYREREEEGIFNKPLEAPANIQKELYRILLMEFIPGIVDGNIELFSRALTSIQYITGKFFSKYQYSIFCCRESEELIKILLENGVKGVGQSSWGPTIYGVLEDYARARKVLSKVLNIASEKGINVAEGFIAKPRNKGASIRYMAP